jgi:hypothetical protein
MWARQAMNARKFEKLSVEIEFTLFRPGALDDVDPFLGKFVTIVMRALRHAEHLEFALVPAGDDVQAEAALADMIGGDHFLGGDQGMEQRRVHGAEDRDLLGSCQQAAGPGDGFECRAVEVARAAVAFPAADRQKKIDPSLVGDARHVETIGPAREPAFRHQRGGARR